MSLEEKLAHVRGDVDSVMRKYQKLMHKERHAFKASRNKQPRIHQSDYRSPRRIEWVVTLRSGRKRDTLFLSAWWHVEGAGLEALCLSPTSAFFFDTHFFQRYRVRESLVRGAVDNMKLFLRTNYNLTIKKLDTYRHGFQEAAGVAQEGLFLGTVRPGDIVACDTFLSEEMLRTDQQTLLGELHFRAHTKDWSHARLIQYGKWFQDKLGELGEE